MHTNLESADAPALASANGATAAQDLFALTDEQILEIAPGAQDVELSDPPPETLAEAQPVATAAADGKIAEAGPFAAPEDVRALAELYPGGLNQAKTAAERARTLDEIDAAYFGAGTGTPEQVSAGRAQLALRMMRDDPAAFREMVFAGLRALEEAGAQRRDLLAVVDATNNASARGNRVGATLGSAGVNGAGATAGGASPAPTGPASESHGDTQTAAYAAFERGANAELERSVGGAIERTIAQALPNLGKAEGESSAGARSGTPLRERLASSVRQEVEAALKGDRQLGEQIAQILAARRFDETARAQVVRLIGERAQQLVPGAARRVINEWTGTALAAHGAKSERSIASSARREVAPAAASSANARAAQRSDRQDPAAAKTRSVDYRKLSDDQILDL